jgi:hypothetical protein
MARSLDRLSDRTARTAGVGMLCDGGRLYLQTDNRPQGRVLQPFMAVPLRDDQGRACG